MKNRDDFKENTKKTLAQRVGYICSNPNCMKQTIGPHSDPNKSLSIGVAAHIKAASPGGPRYDKYMSSEERKSIDNGIWLCENCAKIIDKDIEYYTVELLNNWKQNAENYTENIQRNNIMNNSSVMNDESLKKSLKKLNSSITDLNNMYKYFYLYYEENFNHYNSHLEAMNSLNKYYYLHEDALNNISIWFNNRENVYKEFCDIELDLSEELSNLIRELISLGEFTYQSDNIGFYNNYAEKFFEMILKNKENVDKLTYKICEEIKQKYKTL
ncbi:hypothetical protein NSA42_01530 [Paeniclostridium sordellii]|nr:hypothetical protein [Paeniclostridium sordellii]MCR1847944.1 hypothetical protein [Paeniclostridium sordellii]